jgi:hypothetical protein
MLPSLLLMIGIISYLTQAAMTKMFRVMVFSSTFAVSFADAPSPEGNTSLQPQIHDLAIKTLID